MPYELMFIISTILQLKFPGGIQAFCETGGMIGITPDNTSTLLIYHPDIPPKVKDEMIEAFKITIANITIQFVSTRNYEHRDNLDGIHQELSMVLSNHMLDQLFIKSARAQVTPLYVAILIEDENTMESTAVELSDRIHAAIPDIIRIYVMYHNGCVCREYEGGQEPITPSRIPQKSYLITEHSKRDTVIDDDDILNVKIALENARSIEDLFRNL